MKTDKHDDVGFALFGLEDVAGTCIARSDDGTGFVVRLGLAVEGVYEGNEVVEDSLLDTLTALRIGPVGVGFVVEEGGDLTLDL